MGHHAFFLVSWRGNTHHLEVYLVVHGQNNCGKCLSHSCCVYTWIVELGVIWEVWVRILGQEGIYLKLYLLCCYAVFGWRLPILLHLVTIHTFQNKVHHFNYTMLYPTAWQSNHLVWSGYDRRMSVWQSHQPDFAFWMDSGQQCFKNSPKSSPLGVVRCC